MNQNETIGKNLKRLRMERQLSLGQLSAICGVSKIVLSQMERGESNPTINTVWKIAEGLRVHYTELLEQPQTPRTIVKKSTATLQTEADGAYKSYSYYSASPERSFDWFVIELEPNAEHNSLGHPAGSEEYLFVHRGKLELCLDGQSFILEEGDAFTFKGNHPHLYRNIGLETLNASTLIHY